MEEGQAATSAAKRKATLRNVKIWCRGLAEAMPDLVEKTTELLRDAFKSYCERSPKSARRAEAGDDDVPETEPIDVDGLVVTLHNMPAQFQDLVVRGMHGFFICQRDWCLTITRATDWINNTAADYDGVSVPDVWNNARTAEKGGQHRCE